ncbi:mannose-1-phosphate guanylyltransferase [Planctomycetales bacterium]|nr:mannose-1-phosphate guanylyltransferase [Planctomycetales bacterium]
MNHAVILAGGFGTRLFPESRKERPKQFLSFEGDRTLLEGTLERLQTLVPPERIWILTAKPLATRIETLLPNVPKSNILAEPVGRNTAPAIGWAALQLSQIDSDATMFVLPSDHIIKPASVFCGTLQTAAETVERSPQKLITFGVKPAFAATTFGYIQKGEPVANTCYQVKKFHEKPDAETAAAFLESGDYFWNAGIFVWKAKTIIDLISRFEPELGGNLETIRRRLGTADENAVTEKCFAAMKGISIDYAVLERATDILVMESPFEWNDVGTWRALDQLYANLRDENGNIATNVKLVTQNSSNCTVRSFNPKQLIALIGLDDIVVVETPDITLITKKDQEELVREIVDQLAQDEN